MARGFAIRCKLSGVPLYDYRCLKCGKKFTLLIGVTAEPDDEKCPWCDSTKVERQISRIGKARSEDARLDSAMDKLERMGEPSSHREIRETMKEIGSALDDGMADEMEEVFEADAEEGAD